MTRHRFLAGPFSSLEIALFEAIEAGQREDPLARVDVVVPTNLLGLDLRRRYTSWLAARAGTRGHANLRFLTFLDLARETAGDVPGRPAPPSLMFAAVASAIAQVPEAARFGALRHRVGFARAVEATLRDLRDAGISPGAFRSWVDTHAPVERRGVLEALAQLHAEVARALEDFADDAATFGAAAARAAAAASSAQPLHIYGFYDFTGLQRELVAALARGRPLAVFLPRYGGDLGDFARATEAFLGGILGLDPEPAALEPPGSSRSAFFERLAARETGRELPEDGTLAIVSAADDASEAREVAREIRIARDAGLPLATTAILVRQEADAARLDAALNRAGLPRFRRPAETWADTPGGRALSLWLRLEEEGFRRDEVLDVLELSAVGHPDPRAPHFRGLVRQSGVVRGFEEWSAAVARLAQVDAAGGSEDELRLRRVSRLPGSPEAARQLALRWAALRDSASGWPTGPLTFSGWAAQARRRLARLFEPEEVPEAAEAALAALDGLSQTSGEVSREVAFEVFLSGLASRGAAPGRLGRNGVAILTVMEARGLAFDHVIVPGLVEKSFPARARPDPLLFDDERESLARETGKPIAARTLLRPAEERLLFAIAADASRRKLTLSASRRDSALDRERTLSQFFTRAQDAAGRVRETMLGGPTAFGPPVSLSEARRRALDLDGAEALAALFPPLEAALLRRAQRGEPSFGPFEGRLKSPDLSAALSAHVPGPAKPVSPSALERFCRCAYQYFFHDVLKLKPIEETEEPADLNPLELGTLVHDAARRAALSLRGKPFGELSDGRALSRLAGSCAAEALEAFEKNNGFVLSPPLMREIALDRVRDHVHGWLSFERRPPRGAFAPAGAEVRFGPPTGRETSADPELSSDEPALSGQGVPLRGQIDLVCVDLPAGTARVTDFKVKASPKAIEAIARQRRDGAVLWSGEMLQLPVYALAAAGPIGRKGGLPADVASEYLLLAADPRLEEPSVLVEPVGLDPAGTRDAVEKLEVILETIRVSITEGVFRPRTEGKLRKEQCQHCDYRAVCGPGHIRLYEKKAQNPDTGVRRLDLLGQIP
ncbi:MAG: PD-(D/E)XK nuclease family protein [Thermoanaerobaculia bacterium]